jgi:hypothetical protein
VGDTARARARRTTKKKRDDEEGQAVRDDANDDELFGDGEWVGDDGER